VASYIGFNSKEIDLSDNMQTITLKEDDHLLSEVVVVAYGVQRRERALRAVKEAQPAFGQNEFTEYVRQKADKTVCQGKTNTVRVSFFIDETGKPANINFIRFSCENAKKEAESLLASSPAWTTKNKQITMTLRW
jgi:hypothetical protein